MPKVDIDYSNTIFYKIFCKDSTIKELYVGLTTNFVQRKHAHKQSCKNEKSTNYNCKLYNVIRNAGGWENWQMEIIAFHNCKDSYEAHKKEQEYFEMLGATLNSIEPLPKPKEPITKIVKEKTILYCEPCNIYFSYWKAQEIHNNSHKHHKMVSMYNDNKLATNIMKCSFQKFHCESCEFTSFKTSEYIRHNMTAKHINRTNMNNLEQKNTEQSANQYTCKKCSKNYKARNSLWYHEQKCIVNTTTETEKDKQQPIDDNMQMNIILELVKQNKEFKQLLIEQNKTIIELAKNSQSISNNTQD
jgi:hypothetical protein